MLCSRFRSRGRTSSELTTRVGNYLLPSPSSWVLSASSAVAWRALGSIPSLKQCSGVRQSKWIPGWERKQVTIAAIYSCAVYRWNCGFVVLFEPEWPVVVRRWCSDVSLLCTLLVVSWKFVLWSPCGTFGAPPSSSRLCFPGFWRPKQYAYRRLTDHHVPFSVVACYTYSGPTSDCSFGLWYFFPLFVSPFPSIWPAACFDFLFYQFILLYFLFCFAPLPLTLRSVLWVEGGVTPRPVADW